MQRPKFYLLTFLYALMLACSSRTENLRADKIQDSKFDQTNNSFTEKYLFDSLQNLLKLDVDKLSNFQIDSLLRYLYVMDQKFRIEINEKNKSDSIVLKTRRNLLVEWKKPMRSIILYLSVFMAN